MNLENPWVYFGICVLFVVALFSVTKLLTGICRFWAHRLRPDSWLITPPGRLERNILMTIVVLAIALRFVKHTNGYPSIFNRGPVFQFIGGQWTIADLLFPIAGLVIVLILLRAYMLSIVISKKTGQ